MYIFFALAAAFFAGITSVFGKAGVKEVDSTLATAIRTIIIFLFSIIVVIFIGSFNEIYKINTKNFIFLVLSGITTALLWLSYFKALQLADVSKVSPIDKISIVLTLILSNIFLNEKITYIKIFSMILLILGTYLMTSNKSNESDNNKWIIYAFLTAVFTSLATILGKIGINEIESNFASLIKTIIVIILIWAIVFIKKKHLNIKKISKKSWVFIFLSGLTTGFSWLCYFKALNEGEASIVFPIEKLSIAISVIGSVIFLKEKLKKKSIIGLITIIGASVLLIISNVY